MSDRSIVFSGPMIRALLKDRKTMTRRLIRRRGLYENNHRGELVPICVDYALGDRLWVRETWGAPAADAPGCPDGRKPQHGDKLVFRANPADAAQWGPGLPSQGGFVWRPSIHMPRWASRLTLLVEDVKVERLQEISAIDARAEGIEDIGGECFRLYGGGLGTKSPVDSFRSLWNCLHTKPGTTWDDNPWVAAISFKTIMANIDSGSGHDAKE